MAKREAFLMRVDPEVLDALRRWARDDLRSVNAQVEIIPPWFVAATSVGFVVTAVVLALTCPSQEQLEDWSTHYRKVGARART